MYLLVMDCEGTQWKMLLLILIVISSPSKQDPTIRLADGDDRQGRVEVYIDGEWGTICDDRWDVLDGDVVCRQLGFLYAKKVMDGAFYGEGQGQVLMDEVTCDGTERTLFECQYSRHHNCLHSEDAGVVCSEAFDIRLVNGDETHGRVEVNIDRQWGPICADRWDIIDADIVCRQLGYLYAESETTETTSKSGNSTSSTLLGSVKCKGKENILSECSHVVHPNCTGGLSWVTCSADLSVRLRGGEGKHEGRLEIHADGLWGTVCDEGWNIKNADVVCRQLGFSEAVSASREEYWGEGDLPILMSNVHCQGNELSLLTCGFTRMHSCTHAQDAGVTCKRDEERLEIISCPSDMSVPVPSGVIKAAVEWDDPIVTGRLINTTSSHKSGDLFDLGLSKVTYNFTSKAGNFTSCSFYVALCPTDCNNARQYCPASVTKEVETSTNSSRVHWSEVLFDKCHYNVSKTHTSGDEFFLGITEVTYTCTDSEFVYNLCKFDVRVVREVENEERLEIISCPSDMSVPVPSGVIKAAVEWDDPIVTGRLINITSSHKSGNLFDLGLSKVTYNFTSKAGNFTSCSFYVALCPTDCNNARQYCPASVTKEVETSTNSTRVHWSEVMFDKCHYNVSKTHSSGDEFFLGITEVTYTCTDSEFVYNLCKFDVRVVREVETVSSSVSPLVKNFFEANILVILTAALGLGIFALILLLLIQNGRKGRSISSNRVQLRLNDINIQQSVNKSDGNWKGEGCSKHEASSKDSDTNAVYEEPSEVLNDIKNLKSMELEDKQLYSKHVDYFDENFGTYVTMK